MAQHVLSLLGGLDRERFQPMLACSRQGTLARRAAELCIPVYPLPFISPLRNPFGWSGTIELARLIARERPRIVHAHSWGGWLMSYPATLLFRRRLLLLCTIHSHPPAGPFAQRVVGRVGRKTDRISCVSQALTRLWPGEQANIEVIPNGIDLPDISNSKEELRRQVGLPQDTPVVGTVARFAPQKGIAYLLEAAVRVKGAHFAVIGEGPLKPELEARAQKLGLGERFHFLGRVPDARALLSAFDIIALPSISEGSSIAAMEAMAAGRPIVASRLEALQEIVREGETGLFAAPAEPDELAGAINSLLQQPDLARRMGEAGKRRVHENFSVELMIARTGALYERMVNSRFGRAQ